MNRIVLITVAAMVNVPANFAGFGVFAPLRHDLAFLLTKLTNQMRRSPFGHHSHSLFAVTAGLNAALAALVTVAQKDRRHDFVV